MGITSERDINAINTTNLKQDSGKKHQKEKKDLRKKNEEMSSELTQSETLITYSPSATEVISDD